MKEIKSPEIVHISFAFLFLNLFDKGQLLKRVESFDSKLKTVKI